MARSYFYANASGSSTGGSASCPLFRRLLACGQPFSIPLSVPGFSGCAFFSVDVDFSNTCFSGAACSASFTAACFPETISLILSKGTTKSPGAGMLMGVDSFGLSLSALSGGEASSSWGSDVVSSAVFSRAGASPPTPA